MNLSYINLIWFADKILIYLVGFAGLFTVSYSLVREYAWKKDSQALLNIKRNIYELALAGKKPDKRLFSLIASAVTSRQFLDVTTNRNREVVFFNESEQTIIKDYFASSQKLARIERTALFSFSKWRRIEAILILGYTQARSCVSILKKTIVNKDPDIVYFSIIALGRIKSTQSAEVLLDFAKEHSLYRYRIFSLLESFPSEIAGQVIRLAGSSDAKVRSWAVKLLCRLRVLKYCGQIEEFVKDSSAQVRASACDCLGEFGEKKSSSVLANCLSDNSWMVRVSAVKALFKVAGKDSLPKIMERINDGSLSVIESVKEVIIANIDICSVYLEKFLSGGDEMARRVSVEALETSGYIVKLFRGLLDGKNQVESISVRLIKGLIFSQAYTGLIGTLQSFNEHEQKEILRVIRGIDQPAAVILEESIVKQNS